MVYLNKKDLSNILKMLDMAEQHKENGCGNRSVSKKAITDMKNKINKIINQNETSTNSRFIQQLNESFDSLLNDSDYKKSMKENAKKIKELNEKQKQLFDELCADLAYRSKELPAISKESDD